jgi:hypothetical protein
MNLEKSILDLETDKFNKEKELQNIGGQLKNQSINLNDLNQHNNKLTAELADT